MKGMDRVLLKIRNNVENGSEMLFDDHSETVEQKKQNKPYEYWLSNDGFKFIPSEKLNIYNSVPSGTYKISYNNKVGHFLENKFPINEEIFDLPFTEFDELKIDIKKFYASKDAYEKYKMVYKRGYLILGPAGCGKTGFIKLMANEFISDYDGIVLTINGIDDLHYFMDFVPSVYRHIERDRKIMVVIEDIEGLIDYEPNEKVLLQLLDGIENLDNVIYIATTNYPEKLKERILNRPSRFDRRMIFNPPKEKVREVYLKNKIQDKNIDINDWVLRTDGLTISHLAELVISVFVMGRDFDEVIDELKGMKNLPTSKDFENNKKVGFFNS